MSSFVLSLHSHLREISKINHKESISGSHLIEKWNFPVPSEVKRSPTIVRLVAFWLPSLLNDAKKFAGPSQSTLFFSQFVTRKRHLRSLSIIWKLFASSYDPKKKCRTKSICCCLFTILFSSQNAFIMSGTFFANSCSWLIFCSSNSLIVKAVEYPFRLKINQIDQIGPQQPIRNAFDWIRLNLCILERDDSNQQNKMHSAVHTQSIYLNRFLRWDGTIVLISLSTVFQKPTHLTVTLISIYK